MSLLSLSSFDDNCHNVHNDEYFMLKEASIKMSSILNMSCEEQIYTKEQSQQKRMNKGNSSNVSLVLSLFQNPIRIITMMILLYHFHQCCFNNIHPILCNTNTIHFCFAKSSQQIMQTSSIRRERNSIIVQERKLISRHRNLQSNVTASTTTSKMTMNMKTKNTKSSEPSPTMLIYYDSSSPSMLPSSSSSLPTVSQSSLPTISPSLLPTISPSYSNSDTASIKETIVTYIPGLLTTIENGLTLSEGLTSRIIGISNNPIIYNNGTKSVDIFLSQPDAAATYKDTRSFNMGGWIYTMNFEVRPDKGTTNINQGGVGSITFNRNGDIIHYEMILKNLTYANCGGGKTPWNVRLREISK